MVHIESPWKTSLVQDCPVVDNQYVPVAYLYRMLGKGRAYLESIWADYIYYRVPNGKCMRSFIDVCNLPECLRMLGIWTEDEIECATAQLTHKQTREVTPPRKSGDHGKRSLARDDQEEEVLPIQPKRKYRGEETPPAWADAFIKDMTDLVGKQAVEVYTGTEQFVEDCAKAVQDRVKSLEKELRHQVVQQLRTEMKPKVEAQLKEQIKLDSLKRFQLPAARSVWKAPSNPSKPVSNQSILDKADIFKK